MNNEIVFVCNSVNNRNVRGNELVILRKNEDQKYFEFGENENNIKKRFYKDLETLNKDFEEVSKIKEKLNKQVSEQVSEQVEEPIIEESIELKEERKEYKKPYKKHNKKSLF